MSMNLNCRGFDLQQTPTLITNMCMVQPDGTAPWSLKGKKAIHALRIYSRWLLTHIPSCTGNASEEEERDHVQRWVHKHIEELDTFIEKNKRNIEVFVC